MIYKGLLLLLLLQLASTTVIKQQNLIPNSSGYTVLSIIKKRSPVYTQGLILSDDGKFLYESGGLYGQSSLKKMAFPSLTLVQSFTIGSSYFTEGIGVCGGFLYQLTYKERVIFKYEYPTLKYIGKLSMPSAMKEGWGLANYSLTQLIATDGSEKVFFLDCTKNLAVSRTLRVSNGSYYLSSLNALVFAQGSIFLNVYMSNVIYKVNAATGKVLRSYNMANIVNYELKQGTLTNSNLNQGYVLNGLAYDESKKTFLVTGKKWGFFYELRLNS